MIETYHLSKLYNRGVYALRDLSLTIDKGEFMFLTGPSGAGKSTVLKAVMGLIPLRAGDICLDDRRDTTTLCVVEESRDIVSIEKTGEFRGRYHVLLGAMSPLDGIGPDQLKMKELGLREKAGGAP